MKKMISCLLVVLLIAMLGISTAFAAPVIVNGDTGYTVYSNSETSNYYTSYGTGTGNSIVLVDPSTNKPVQTAEPAPTYYIVDTSPVVTKNPTNESAKYGDEVVFVARADYYDSITWYLTDGTTYFPASEVGTHFTGVTATGTGTERLVLSGVTDKMDGWSATARFDNAIGSAWSGQAKLAVEADPSASPTPSPTPIPSTAEATPTPVPANLQNGTGGTGSSTATQHGTNISSGTAVGNSNNTAIGTTAGEADITTSAGITTTAAATSSSAGSARNSHVGAYILAAFAGLVILGSVVVMALYMKGKISLGKFEKFLGSFDKGAEDDMFDNDGEFYNPDDFKDTKDT